MTSGKAINPMRLHGKGTEIDDDLYLAERVHAERDRSLYCAEQKAQKRTSRSGLPWLAVARSVA